MFRIFYVILTALTILSIHACDYDLGDHYFVDLEVPERPDFEINLSIPGDTLFLTEDTRISIPSVENLKNRAGIDIYFNDKIYQRDLSGLEFNLAVNTVPTGYYKLEVVIRMNSGSGSMADQEGLEAYSVNRSWVVHVNTDAPAKTEFVSVAAVDGTLMLTWKESTDPRFAFYRISKMCDFEVCRTFEITDIHQVSMNDQSFIGGTTKYRIEVFTKSKISSGTNEIQYTNNVVFNTEWEWSDDVTAHGTWRKHPFYNNVSAVIVESQSISDPNDTTITVTTPRVLKFGENYLVKIKVSPKNGDPIDYNTNIYRGKKCHLQFYNAQYNSNNGLYYTIYRDQYTSEYSLYLFGEDKRNPLNVVDLNTRNASMSFSVDGETVFVYDSYVSPRIIEYDAETLTRKSTHSITNLPGVSTFYVSSDEKMAIDNKVYDLKTNTLLFTAPGTIKAFAPDGSQLFSKTSRYVWNGSTYVEQTPASFSTEPTYLKQFSQDSMAVIRDKSKFEIRNPQTNEVLVEKDFGTNYFSIRAYEYDPFMHRLNIRVNDSFSWYDIKTGTTSSVPNVTRVSVSAANKYLICNIGYYMELE